MTAVTTQYTIVDGTYYHAGTDMGLINLLERIRKTPDWYVYVTYCWGMTTETIRCTVGRSTGEIKIPLEIRSRRSYGGAALSDDCIIEVRGLKKDGGRILWRRA